MPEEFNNNKKTVEEAQEYLTNDQIPGVSLNKSQKIAVAVLAFFAVFVVIFWSISFKTSLKESLRPTTSSSGQTSFEDENTATCANGECQADNDRLKSIDTDKDGLSDWDELNLYKTSPYLEDSDSDGYSDKKEIDSNNDPNCPQGQTCVSTSDIEESGSMQVTENIIQSNDLNSGSASNNTYISSTSSNIGENTASIILGGGVDAKTLRSILESSGFDKDILDKMTDDELMAIYKESLNNK